jgi:hypothetical protein
MLWTFIGLKNPLASAVFNPWTWGPMASTLTTRPPRMANRQMPLQSTVHSLLVLSHQTTGIKKISNSSITCFVFSRFSRQTGFRNVDLCGRPWKIVQCTTLHYIFHIWTLSTFPCLFQNTHTIPVYLLWASVSCVGLQSCTGWSVEGVSLQLGVVRGNLLPSCVRPWSMQVWSLCVSVLHHKKWG